MANGLDGFTSQSAGDESVTLKVDLSLTERSLSSLETRLREQASLYGERLNTLQQRFSDGIELGVSGVDTQSLDAAFNEIKSTFKKQVDEIKASSGNEFGFVFGDETPLMRVAKSYEEVEKSIEGAIKAQDEFGENIADIGSDVSGSSAVSELESLLSLSLDSINSDLEKTSDITGKVKSEFGQMMSSDANNEALAKLSESLGVVEKQVDEKLPKAWGKFAILGATALFGLASAAFIAFSKVESVITGLEIRLGSAAGSADELRESIGGIARNVNTSVEDAAGAVTIATRLGKTKEEAFSLTNQLADLATVTGDLTGATGAVVFSMNTFGDSAGTVEEISNKLFIAWRDGSVQAGELQNALGLIGPLAVGAGISFDELIATFTRAGQQGMSVSETMNGIIQILPRFEEPTKSMAEAMDSLGVVSLPKAIEKFGTLSGVLFALKKYSDENNKSFSKLVGGLKNVQLATVLMGEEGSGVVDIMKDMSGASDELSIAAGKVADDIGVQFKAMKREMGEALDEIGSGVAFFITPLLNMTAEFVKSAASVPLFASSLKNLGKAIVILIPALFAVKVGLAALKWQDHASKIQLAIQGYKGLFKSVKTMAINMKAAVISMKATEIAAKSLKFAIAGIGVAVVALAAFEVWSALQKRMEKIKAAAEDIQTTFNDLISEDSSLNPLDAFNKSISETSRGLLRADDDMRAFIAISSTMGLKLDDIASSALDGGRAFTDFQTRVNLMLIEFKEAVPNNVIQGLIDEGISRNDIADLTNKLREISLEAELAFNQSRANIIDAFDSDGTTQEIDILEFFGFGPKDDVYKASLEAIAVIEETSEKFIKSNEEFLKRVFNVDEIPPNILEILSEKLVDDESKLVDVFARIDDTVDSSIKSLMRTIFTKPIEQMEGGADAFAETLLHNVEVIEAWKNTIDAFKGSGEIRLAEQLAQMGPEATAAFVDIFNQGPAVREAFEGTLNEAFGGFSIEEYAGTYGNSLAEVFAGDKNLQATIMRYGSEAAVSYFDSAVDVGDEYKGRIAELIKGIFEGEDILSAAEQAILEQVATGFGGPAVGERYFEDGKRAGTFFPRGVASGASVPGELKRVWNAGLQVGNQLNLGARRAMKSDSPSKVAIKTGKDYIKGIWIGVLENLSSDAEKVGGMVGKAVNSAVSKSLREGVKTLGSAFKTILNANNIQRQINETYSSIADLIDEIEFGIPDAIKATQEELDAALKTGAEGIITNSEQVSIERAEKSLKDYKLAYEQGFVSAAELAVAEEELTKTRKDAIVISDEVVGLQEDLIDLADDLTEAEDNLADAIDSLNVLFIDAALNMIDIIDAIGEIESATPAVIEEFGRLADAAGIPIDAWRAMTSTIKTSVDVYKKEIETAGVKINFIPGKNARQGGGGISPSFGASPDLKINIDFIWEPIPIDEIINGRPGPGAPQPTVSIGLPPVITPGASAIGGTLKMGEYSFVGERGPELIRGPATVLGTKETASLLGRRTGGGDVQVNVNVTPNWPIDSYESRVIAETIRDAVIELEREEV